jgi:hypothetical protein
MIIQERVKEIDTQDLLKREFGKLGFSILFVNRPPSANGVDLWVQKEGRRPMSVEIKRARKDRKTKAFKVDPVQRLRTKDDLIAIIINKDYVLIESMEDHLKCCSKTGVRALTTLCG